MPHGVLDSVEFGRIVKLSDDRQTGWIIVDGQPTVGKGWLEFPLNRRRRLCHRGINMAYAAEDESLRFRPDQSRFEWKPVDMTLPVHIRLQSQIAYKMGPDKTIKFWSLYNDCLDALAASISDRYAITRITSDSQDAQPEIAWLGLGFYFGTQYIRVNLSGTFPQDHKAKSLWKIKNGVYFPAQPLEQEFNRLRNARVSRIVSASEESTTAGWRAV